MKRDLQLGSFRLKVRLSEAKRELCGLQRRDGQTLALTMRVCSLVEKIRLIRLALCFLVLLSRLLLLRPIGFRARAVSVLIPIVTERIPQPAGLHSAH